MAKKLTSDETSAIKVLLQVGNNVKDIAKITNQTRESVTAVARELDLEPANKTQKRAKALFASDAGMTYADIANALASEGLTNDGNKVHYLTVATWAANQGWAWGGSDDGDYSPDRRAIAGLRSKYTLRMSQTTAMQVNGAKAINAAADAAWAELQSEATTIVAVAVVKGAAAAGATDIAAVKAALMDRHGDAIRTAKA